MDTFTLVHVLISLIGIGSGFIVLAGMIGGNRLDGWTATFLTSTVFTSVTGFLFPFNGITPGIVVGMLSLIVLGIAILARYQRNLAGGWRRTYVIGAVVALYFNVFVLIVQSFQKIPALQALAPTQTEPPFQIAQLATLLLFVALGTLATKRFQPATATVTPMKTKGHHA